VRFVGRAAFGIIILLGTTPGWAVECSDALLSLRSLSQWGNLSGSLRSSYWSSSRTLDDREHLAVAALWLKATPQLGPHTSLFVEGWVMNQQLFREQETAGELREAYLDVSLSSLDLRVGKQIIAWGQADRINPTDNLTPRNFTRLFTEDDDQRLGTVALKATYYFSGLALTGVWLPDFESDTIPLRRPPPLFTLREREPGKALSQGAIKLGQTGKAVDWSVSYFDGFDLFPDLGIERISPAGVDLLLRNHRIRVIGADAATTFGRYGLRGEAAYTFTTNSRGNDPAVKSPFFFLVMGGDRTFFTYLNVNLQYLFRVIVNFHSPFGIQDPLQRAVAIQQAVQTNQLDRTQHGVSLRINYKWFNETLEGEVVGVFVFTRGGYVLRPKLSYALTDRWKVVVGADVFRGPRPSFFDNLRKNSAAYTELRWSF
jgi:hypothetical protein